MFFLLNYLYALFPPFNLNKLSSMSPFSKSIGQLLTKCPVVSCWLLGTFPRADYDLFQRGWGVKASTSTILSLMRPYLSSKWKTQNCWHMIHADSHMASEVDISYYLSITLTLAAHGKHLRLRAVFCLNNVFIQF